MSREYLASLCNFKFAFRKTCLNLVFGLLLYLLFGEVEFSLLWFLGFREFCFVALLRNICRLFWVLLCLVNQFCLRGFLNCRMECLFRLWLWLILLVPYLYRLWKYVSFVLKDLGGLDYKYSDRSFRQLVIKFLFSLGVSCL